MNQKIKQITDKLNFTKKFKKPQWLTNENKFYKLMRVLVWILLLIIVPVLIVARPYYQGVFLFGFKNIVELLLGATLITLFVLFFKKRMKKSIVALILIPAMFVGLYAFFGVNPQEHIRLTRQYHKLEIKDLGDYLPLTEYPRYYPLHSVGMASKRGQGETKFHAEPDFAIFNGIPSWTIMVEPAKYPTHRWFGKMEDIFVFPGHTPILDFSGENKTEVSFKTAENMHWLHNTNYLATQKMGPINYMRMQPSETMPLMGPDGKMVLIVSLIKWDFLLSAPQFGGVVVINENDGDITELMKRAVIGEGNFLPAHKIKDHDWLKGQALMPVAVSRHIAESFRIHKGLFEPLFHYEDYRIPDMPGDNNNFPLTLHFNFEDKGQTKLYHYYEMQPYDDEIDTVSLILFIPGDGIGPVYVYDCVEQEQSIMGRAAVLAEVRSPLNEVNWQTSQVAEPRPYICDIEGERRFFRHATVVQLATQLRQDGTTVEGLENLRDKFIANPNSIQVVFDSKTKDAVRVSQNYQNWPEEIAAGIFSLGQKINQVNTD